MKETRGKDMKNEISKQDLWDFSLKEICKNLECSPIDFVLDRKRYMAFKRRFNYFIKPKLQSAGVGK